MKRYKLFKTNMTDIMDAPAFISQTYTAERFRRLDKRAKRLKIHTGKSGVDSCCGVWFEITRNEKRIRYTLVDVERKHDYDDICIPIVFSKF